MAQQTQDQPQKRSNIDRLNSGINNARGVLTWGKRLKRGIQYARALVGFFSSGAGEALLIILFIGIGALLLLFIVAGPSAKAGQVCTTQTVTSPGSGTGVAPDLTAASQIIKFGGAKSACSLASGWCGQTQEFPTQSQKDTILGVYAKIFGSSRYRTIFGSSPVYLYFYTPTISGGTNGGAFSTSIMAWTGLLERLSSDDTKKTLIHELNHVLDMRRSRISDGNTSYGGDRYSRTSLVNSDPHCYNGCWTYPSYTGDAGSGNKYIKTYGYRDCDNAGGGANHESFAESIADYVMCKPGELCNYTDYNRSVAIKFNDTNGDGACHATYAWIKKNIFGGDDFFGGSTSTQTVTVCVTQPPTTAQNTNCSSLTGEAEFECLTRGQGRNTTALGSNLTAFINNVLRNIGGRSWANATNQTYLAKIYNAAIATNVNPVMPLVIWGVEASWTLNGTEFGCISQRGSGFDNQLQCSVNILNRWMNYFTQNQTNGTLSVHGCTFTDMFAYAYEWYTPICGSYGNDPSRTNFINFYKIIVGI